LFLEFPPILENQRDPKEPGDREPIGASPPDLPTRSHPWLESRIDRAQASMAREEVKAGPTNQPTEDCPIFDHQSCVFWCHTDIVHLTRSAEHIRRI